MDVAAIHPEVRPNPEDIHLKPVYVKDLPPSVEPMTPHTAAREKELAEWNKGPAPVTGPNVPEGCCGGCARPLEGPVIEALHCHWHIACWKCSDCDVSLDGGVKFRRRGPTDPRPICLPCYNKANTLTCYKCKQIISNAYVEIPGRGIYVHPQCQ